MVGMANGRLGSKKSKTGCNTCRIRKVKCDEQKPYCKRCVSTGRKCDGYRTTFQSTALEDWPRKDDPSNRIIYPSPERVLADFAANRRESRSLAFFRDQVAPALSGPLDSSFWCGIVLQISHSEPAIRYAICAVGSLFEQMREDLISFRSSPLSSRSPSPQILSSSSLSVTASASALASSRNDHNFAIQCYSKALDATRQRISSDAPPGHIPLLTCILFICIEFLRGNAEEALDLCSRGSTLPALLGHNKGHDPYGPIFNRLKVLAATHGRAEPDSEVESSTADYCGQQAGDVSAQASVSDARTILYKLMDNGHRPIRKATAYGSDPAPDPALLGALFEEQQNLYWQLQGWQARIDHLRGQASTQEEIFGCSTLYMYSLTSSIWLQTALQSSGESAFDAHRHDFELIIEHAESSLAMFTAPWKTKYTGSSPVFTFEMGVIPPLYFTATKCRDPNLRRTAVSLLQRSPLREGLWDADEMAAVARRIISLEEEGLVSARWPEEQRRVCDATFGLKRIAMADGEGNGLVVGFHFRHMDGSIRIQEEFVRIQ